MASHQAWKFALAAGLCAAVWPASVKAATYNMSIQSVPAAGGKCVGAPNGQSAEGMHVLLWDCNSFLNQNLAYDDQTQELKFGANCVGILGQGSAEDPVGVGKCTGAVTQRWGMIANGDSYQVLGANSLCLNITNGVVANGTPLNLDTCVPNTAVQLWTLLEATDPATAAQAAAGSGAGTPGASGQTPGQMASASSPNTPGSGSGPGGGSGSGSDPSASGGPSGGGSGPGRGSGGGSGGGGPSGGGGSPGGGSGPMSALPDPLTILAGLLNPPGSGFGDRPRGRDRDRDRNRDPNQQPMGPNMGGAAPGPGQQPGPPMGANTPPGTPGATPGSGATPGAGGMPGTGGLGPPPGPNTTPATPAAGGSPLPQNLCGLTANGQLVQVNISMPPPAANQPTDTGQYCVSGGPRNGQCGTVTVDNVSNTARLCGNGLCTPPIPPTPRGAYTQTLFGLPDSTPVVPCPMSTTASNDPLGGLGPPMMDQRTGQPGYQPRPVGMPMGSLPAAPQIITLAVPVPPVGGTPNRPRTPNTPNVCQPKTPGHASDPHGGQPKTQTPATPKANDGPLKLKPNPGATQLASSTPSHNADPAPLCESKPPYLPWGGHGSATITVSGGKPCGIGWHDTGATILENITVTSQPKHGTIAPKSKNIVIFTPTPGYKGQDTFMLRMNERNGSRRATLTVTVNVTIR